eukprot:s4430_g4.t1
MRCRHPVLCDVCSSGSRYGLQRASVVYQRVRPTGQCAGALVATFCLKAAADEISQNVATGWQHAGAFATDACVKPLLGQIQTLEALDHVCSAG